MRYAVKRPRGKSYVIDRPDGARRPPSWVDEKASDRLSVITDDVHIQLAHYKYVSSTLLLVAWIKGRTWFEAKIDRSRVREVQRLT